MAESKKNIVTHGLSGKVGGILVFSQRHGKTIVSKAPTRTGELTDNQKQHIQKFQQAVIYAKTALTNPATKADYAAAAGEGASAYNIAVADMLQAPDIESIDLSSYAGKVGDKIIVKATDDFKVTQVSVGIYKPDGTLIEKGNAVINANGIEWDYTATVANAGLSGDTTK
ncbi:MAG: hypothetical protein WDM71_02610 [Ferruginibacter sp.]